MQTDKVYYLEIGCLWIDKMVISAETAVRNFSATIEHILTWCNHGDSQTDSYCALSDSINDDVMDHVTGLILAGIKDKLLSV